MNVGREIDVELDYRPESAETWDGRVSRYSCQCEECPDTVKRTTGKGRDMGNDSAMAVVETFLPASRATLESLAGRAAMIAHSHRMRALELRGASGADEEWQAAEHYTAISDGFRFVIAGDRLTDY